MGGGVVLGCAVHVDDGGEAGFDPKAEGGPVFEEHFQPDGLMAGGFGLLSQSGHQFAAVAAVLVVGVQDKHGDEEDVGVGMVMVAVEVADGLIIQVSQL